MLSISVRFDLNEPHIGNAVMSGSAKCAAMVYCGSTLYRSRFEASPGNLFVAEGSVPVSRLKNEVEVHPVILAARDLIHSTVTAHPEYEGRPAEVHRLAPLATDLHWTFEVDSDTRPVRSIFRLSDPDDTGRLRDGEFDVNVDPNHAYIDVIANSETLNALNIMRRNDRLAVPTVFTSALITVLAYLRNIEEDEAEHQDENCEWMTCLRTQLRRLDINILGDTLLLAAQRLLESPFKPVLEQWSTLDTDD